MIKKLFAAAVLMVAVVGTASAAPIRTGFDANTLAANDDGSTGAVSIGFTLNFFGINRNTLFVNNNGNVTLDSSLGSFTPFDLNTTGREIIAPFFADVDTGNNVGQEVTFGNGTVNGRNAFGVNWIDVNYFNNFVDNGILNDFQLVLIDRSDTGVGNFDIEFNYEDILWETGTASGGNSLGLGGTSARVGFSNGTGTSFEFDGSAINGAFLNGGANALISNSNVGIDGRYVFEARSGTINPSVVPVPAALPLLATALCGFGLISWRKKRAVA